MVLINSAELKKLLKTYEKKKRLLEFTRKRLSEIRGFDVEQEIAFQERIEELEKMLSFIDEALEGSILDHREQSLIYYLVIEGWNYSEVANFMGINRETVRSISGKAYSKLLKAWERWE